MEEGISKFLERFNRSLRTAQLSADMAQRSNSSLVVPTAALGGLTIRAVPADFWSRRRRNVRKRPAAQTVRPIPQRGSVTEQTTAEVSGALDASAEGREHALFVKSEKQLSLWLIRHGRGLRQSPRCKLFATSDLS